MSIRIAGIVKNSITDGPGLRYVVFAQGCKHNCPGCHNPETHNADGGELADTRRLAGEVKSDPILSGVTFSGGEPFEQPEAFSELADLLPGTNIVCYTGYLFEQLIADEKKLTLLKKIDILVDGRFDIKQKSYDLKFRGSANQRILDAKESVRRGEAVQIDF